MVYYGIELLIFLACMYAALSWMIPKYLLKPPVDDPDGQPRLTMPHVKRPHLPSDAARGTEHQPRRLRARRSRRG